jgi:NADPH-dependent F420 reductase
MVEAASSPTGRNVGIAGGTGKLGTALALRLASAGNTVVIGSRSVGRAVETATTISAALRGDGGAVTGGDNAAACAVDGVVIITVPYEGLDDTLAGLAGAIGDRIVVSTVVPMRFVSGDGFSAVDVPAGSASEQVAAQLPAARVVGALQTLSYVVLRDLTRAVDSDVILTGDDHRAKRVVAHLLSTLAGVRIVDGGALRNSRHVEQLTVLLLSINGRYRRHTGVRITDLPDSALGGWEAPPG